MGLVGVTAGQQDPGGLVGVRLAGHDRNNRTAEVRRDLGIVADKDTQRGLIRRRLRGRCHGGHDRCGVRLRSEYLTVGGIGPRAEPEAVADVPVVVLWHRQARRIIGVDLYSRVRARRVLGQCGIGRPVVEPESIRHITVELEQELLLDPGRVVSGELELSR